MTKAKVAAKNRAVQEIMDKGREAIREFDNEKEVSLPAIQSKLISIRLPINMLRQLRSIAVAKGNVGYQQIIKTYLAEGIRSDYEAMLHGPTISDDALSSATSVELTQFEAA